jgi:hypothetical protein
LVPGQAVLATSSFPARARVAKKGVNRKPQEDKGILPGQKGVYLSDDRGPVDRLPGGGVAVDGDPPSPP